MITEIKLPIEFPLSRTIVGLLVGFSLYLVLAGTTIWVLAPVFDGFTLDLVRCISVVMLTVGLFIFVRTVTHWVYRPPLLIVDSEGILDRTTSLSVGRIRWDEMASFRSGRMGFVPAVFIELRDPEKKFLELGAFRRPIIRQYVLANQNYAAISARALGIKADELCDVLIRSKTLAQQG